MWTFIIIAIAVLVVAAIIVVFLQRSYQNKAKQLGEIKARLVAFDINQDLIEARKLSLIGQSLKDYQTLESRYSGLEKNKFMAIDRQLELVLNGAAGVNLLKAKGDLDQLRDLVGEATDEVQAIRTGLKELNDTSQAHKKAIAELHGSYAIIRQSIDDQREAYGPAYHSLLQFINQLENDYQEFATLTESGDQAAASNVYEQLAMENTQLANMQTEIPDLFTRLNIKFVEQLAELFDGYQTLRHQGIIFLEDIADRLSLIDQQREVALALLVDLKIKETQQHIDKIEQHIQDVYDLLEGELNAQQDFQTNVKAVDQGLERLREQNQNLFVELERLRQSYRFTHHELENRRGFLEQIDMIGRNVTAANEQLHQAKITYSQAVGMQERWLNQMQEINTSQIELWQQIIGIEPAFQSAKQICDQNIDSIQSIRQRLERMNLPGLPKVYLEFYYSVSDEIKRLDDILRASLVDMDDVQRQLNIVVVDSDTLHEKTQKIVDEAIIAEQLLQYSNRYRQSNQMVAEASQEARQIYNNDYNYSKVMDVLGPVLDKVDAGIYDHIVESYQRHRNVI
ncbi:septation ring formation regulator EzrA [Convivina intestini]|uniref:septation ring formation regulator EzrA n=1 Tax=Convivina intestini TaxID=1505726 RepID=UPI0020109F7B|nr:septation ring formation regulator EzrA [Convivina intestini]CAH1857355.1 Septation ring formation regulator EzrA [Convivina intestini]